MNRSPDVELVLREWFADDGAPAPDYLLDAVEVRISRQPQRRSWRLQGRPLVNSIHLKLAAGVAAVLIVGFAAWQLLPDGRDSGGRPSPSPIPSTLPSTAPSPTAVFPPWYPPTEGSGILPAGTRTTLRFLAGTTLTLPAGWVNDSDNIQIYALFPNSPANEDEWARSEQLANDVLVARTVANNLFTICDEAGLYQGTTASELIDWAVTNEAFITTDPVDVTIGGLSGFQIDVRLDPAWSGSCPLQGNDPPDRDYGDARARIIILDVPGDGPIGFHIGSKHSATFEAFLAEAMPIVESFEFNLEP